MVISQSLTSSTLLPMSPTLPVVTGPAPNTTTPYIFQPAPQRYRPTPLPGFPKEKKVAILT